MNKLFPGMQPGRSHSPGWIGLLTVVAICFQPSMMAQGPISTTTPPPGQPAAPVVNGSAQLVSAYDTTQMLRLAIALKPPQLDEERDLVRQLHDKKSPNFHRFLTADQWNARFAPSAQDEQVVVNWAQSQGLTITSRYPNRLLVDVQATVGTIQKALSININHYAAGSVSFFSNDRQPTLPTDVAGIVWAVLGLNSFEQERPVSKRMTVPARPDYLPGPVVAVGPTQHGDADPSKLPARGAKKSGGTAPAITGGAYDPTDIYSSEAYDFNALYAQGHCCNPLNNPGQSPPETSIAVATYMAQDLNDIAGFHNQYPYLAYNIQLYDIDGTPASGDGEGTMDAEWSTAMSNSFGSYVNTSKVYVYQGANYLNSTVTDLYNHMLTDGYARIFSTSWACAEYLATPGGGDCYAGTMNARDAIFLSMVGQGWTLVAASGDEGATATWCSASNGVFYPASDPNVIAAGGTTLSLNSFSDYISETGWTGGPYGCFSNDGGSTGGFSSYWSTPYYQSAMGFGSRAVPDLALNADWYNTPQNMYFEGFLQGNGGTSIVAPELAGFFAQENAYLLSLGNICGSGSSPCAPMGNANYYIYLDGLYGAPHFPFYDITTGCNNNDITAAYGLGYYCSGVGYDEVTGWGSANMLQLAWAINWYSAPAIGSPSFTFAGPTVNKWYNTDQTVSWTIADNGGGYPATGVAGFTQGWDSIPTDPYSEPTPGAGNSFYSGPQFPNVTSGWLDFTGSGVSQGCHTVFVEAWNNMGSPSGNVTYGPLCYDTIAPVTTATLSGTLSGSVYVSPVKVTLSATDSSSGVASTVYQINGGAVTTYTAPFTVSALGSTTVTFHSTDVAGNVESTKTASFTIDANTTTTLASSLNPSTYEKSVTFTATVTSGSGTPTGTVTFKNGSSTLGTGTLSGGKATYATLTLPAGTLSITAIYAGSGSFLGSTSAALTQTVNKAGSSTTVTSSLNPSALNQTVTFTATVKSATAGVPLGTVTFANGGSTLGTGTLNNGIATLAVSSLSIGSHSITAAYSGGPDFNSSTSAILTQVVNKAGSTTTLTSSINPSVFNQSVKFTATVKSTTSGTPTGTVTFLKGTTTLGTATLNSSGVATFTVSTLTVASHNMSATYSGDSNFNTSVSPTLSQLVNKANTTTAVVSSLNPSVSGKTVTFTATVTPAFGGTPTGTVTFKDGATVLGTGTLNPSGKATFATSTLSTGTHSIKAAYGGDGNYNSSTSSALSQVVNP